MQSLLKYVEANKEWLFSGAGIVAVSGIFGLIRWIFKPRARAVRESVSGDGAAEQSDPVKPQGGQKIPTEWQTILPAQSKYEFVSEERSDIPLGLQSFSYEYGPQGHASPLALKNSFVRAEVNFSCRIDNPYKAMFAANDFALNVLPPRFLLQARGILEGYSLAKLREKRAEASAEIVALMAPQFEQLGVRLESVSIGALEQVQGRQAQ